jgi:hypothetical protein
VSFHSRIFGRYNVFTLPLLDQVDKKSAQQVWSQFQTQICSWLAFARYVNYTSARHRKTKHSIKQVVFFDLIELMFEIGLGLSLVVDR